MTQRMVDLLAYQNWGNPNPNQRRNHRQDDFDDVLNIGDEDEDTYEKSHKEDLENLLKTRCWEVGLRIEIPKFHDSLQPKEFLD
ncbi:conserved hypothetical protein [Ricinus communis]|uniref:Uncharacterized protein n=1 Tax=Ricinus communis TaxID=3988 RepID=B9T416_RICCO|nr:conserved hypothetical protein [Ricinus communis]